MLWLIFAVTLIGNAIATAEILSISRLRPVKAILFAALNSACWWLTAILVVSDMSHRWEYLCAIVAANSIATGAVVLYWRDR